jgi:sigma-B regulation protein RsbU (phosphoserine phosphatase)
MKSLFVANSAGKDIEGFFASSNAAIKNSNLKRMMAGFAMLNIKDHKALYINAGMPSVYHYIKNKKEVEEVKQHNLPLGAMKIEKYNATEISLNKGDVLLLMTDGFPELYNPEKELFGYERVMSSFKKSAEKEPEEIIKYLNDEGTRWRKDKELQDDVTFVVVKVK